MDMESEPLEELLGGPSSISKWMVESLAAERSQFLASQAPGLSRSTHHTAPTSVLPKAPLQECPHANNEGIFNAFSPNAIGGIRSLPNALSPDYRQQLFVQLMETERLRQAALQQRQQSHSAASCSQRQSAGQLNGNSRSSSAKSPQRTSGKAPKRYGPMQGYFSTFDHTTSEYDRSELLGRFAKLSSKVAEMSPDAFVVRGCPRPPAHTTAFSDFTFTAAPYQEVDYLGRAPVSQQQERHLLAHGAFVPAGKGGDAAITLKGLADEFMAQLEKQIAKHWPGSFLKVFADPEGALVVSFDSSAAAEEGDLAAYMNHEVKHGTLMQDYRLTKDPTRWGVTEGSSAVSVFYVLQPPWYHSKPSIPEELQGHVPHYEQPPHVNFPAHGFNRNPFGTTTPAGMYLSINTRPFEKSVVV